MLADIPVAVATSPAAFVLGLVTGFVLSNRWRLVRRDPETLPARRTDADYEDPPHP